MGKDKIKEEEKVEEKLKEMEEEEKMRQGKGGRNK